MMFAGSKPPSGFLLCDGTLYNITDYPALAGIIRYTYGGSGAQFAVPDMRGRSPMNINPQNNNTNPNLSQRSLGDSSGEDSCGNGFLRFLLETLKAGGSFLKRFEWPKLYLDN